MRSTFLVALLIPYLQAAEPALPRIAPRTPEEQLKSFVVQHGFRVDLVAAEPLVQSPMACDFDEHGRLFVVELPEYNDYAATKPHGKGRVVLLEDTNQDGTYDKRTVFVDQLNYPTGVLCWNGGVYVGASPDLLYCKDTNGDGKADERTVILTGFGKDKAGEGQLNSFRWTLEQRILISTGLDGGDVRYPHRDDRTVSVRAMNILLDPKTNTFEVVSGGGQHGMSQDDWGRTFVSGNSDPIHQLQYDARYLAGRSIVAPPAAANILPSGKFTKLHRLSEVEPWRIMRTKLRKEGAIPGSDEGGTPAGFFTGATGVTVYRGHAFPATYRDNIFVGEVANNLLFRATTKPKGVGLEAERADATQEFFASKDVWFRPVQLANAPDGCLYVLDMYRELIEGAAFLAPQVLKNVDPSAGLDKGRIWRIAPEGTPRDALPRLGTKASSELVALLDHANGWHRDTASRLLYQRDDATILPALRTMAKDAKTPQGRLHALWLLHRLKGLELSHVVRALQDTHPRVREHAIRLAEGFRFTPSQMQVLWELRRDMDVGVRYQLAYSLGRIDTSRQTAAVYVQLALKDAADPLWRVAILAGVTVQACPPIFAELCDARDFRRTPHGQMMLAEWGELLAADASGAYAETLLKAISAVATPEPALARSLLRALNARGSTLTLAYLAHPNVAPGAKILTQRLLGEAVTTARDPRKPVAERVLAIRDLQLLPFAEVLPILTETLTANQPPAVQVATLEALGKFGDDRVPKLILDAWSALSPTVRPTATEVFFSRGQWVQAFLDAVEAKTIARADVDPVRVALLQKSPVRNVSARALKLFAVPAGDRQKVYEQYRPALEMKGDVVKGKALFKTNCAACHKLEGVGEELGADLKAVRDRGLEGVLLNILDPNREVKPQYLVYTAELKSGRQLSGLITAETVTSITLRKADGRSETITRGDLESLKSSGLSFMPEGLEKQLDHQAMADLLAYLNSIK